MTYTEFVNAVREAGWTDSGDAQHRGICSLWKRIFPDVARIEELEATIEILEQRRQ